MDVLAPQDPEEHASLLSFMLANTSHLLLTAEPHLEADSEAGLHDFTNRLIGQMSSNWCQQEGPQDLEEEDCWCR